MVSGLRGGQKEGPAIEIWVLPVDVKLRIFLKDSLELIKVAIFCGFKQGMIEIHV